MTLGCCDHSAFHSAMSLSRRSFFKASAGLLAATAFSAEPQRPLVGSQLYGWGQYYQREGKKLTDHLDEIFSALRDAGYDYAEHSLSENPEGNFKLGERMKDKGLNPVSFYAGGALHDAAKAETAVQRLIAGAKGAREAGFTIINCNPDPIGRDKSDEELAVQAQSLQKLGDGLAELGMKLGVHNHTPEMRNDAREFHANFRNTKPGTVGFCYDVHWVFRGGVTPPDALKAYGSRIVSWHLRQSREKIWWEDLDTGDVDYAFIANYARENHLAPFYTVELAIEGGTKITRSVVENHARSREFVRRVFSA
jgi:inosose dehydratase